jgi:hypothetical protein
MTSLPDANVAVPKYLLERERAQRSDRLIQVVAVVLGVLCLAAAAGLQRPINKQRNDLQLVTNLDLRDLPPKYAWITAMAGSFRGLAIDLLWMRSEDLKEQGKYYELAQIGQWICTLQPRFAAVWAYQAWNMSYNISVATHTPEERWQWVYNGIRLLRDQGIPNNPQVIGLYKELSWIIFHKVGDLLDDMHWYYKREWASIFENLLGAPPLSGDAQAVIDAFRPVAGAPRTWDEFVAKHPTITQYIGALNDAGVDLEAQTSPDRLRHPLETTFFDRYSRFIAGTEVSLAQYRKQPAAMKDDDRKFVEAFRAMPADLGDAFVAYLRAKVLREQYKMHPKYMLSLMTDLIPGKPGMLVPLDWRMPDAHAIYWSRYGVEEGRRLKNYSDNDVLQTDRFTLFSLMTLCKRGRLIFEMNHDKPNRSALDLAPDLRMVEPMHDMFLALGKVHAEPGEDVGDTAGEMLRSGHVNTLEEAIVLFYARGDLASAQKYLNYLRENYKEFDGSTKRQYSGDLESFVMFRIKEQTESFKEALALVHEFLRGGLLSLAEGDAATYGRQVERAGYVWQTYMKDKAAEREGRLHLPPFDDMRADALREFLVRMPSILLRITVWQQFAELPIRQAVYNDPRLVEYLRQECEATGYDFNKAFPEPAGMDAYRKAHPQRDRPEEEARKEQEKKLSTP